MWLQRDPGDRVLIEHGQGIHPNNNIIMVIPEVTIPQTHDNNIHTVLAIGVTRSFLLWALDDAIYQEPIKERSVRLYILGV